MVILRVITLGTIAALFLGLAAIALKGGGTTARIHEIAFLFVPSAVVGLVLLFATEGSIRRLALLSLVASAAGIALPFYLQATGALADYEKVMQNEQSISQHPFAWLSLYGVLTAGALAAAWYGSTGLSARRG
jgi:hypothetical protein